MDNTNEMNRENDKLVSTEDVCLTSDSKKEGKGKTLKGILLVCALVIVVAIWVLSFLGNIEKRIVEEEMNEVNTQATVFAEVPKENSQEEVYTDTLKREWFSIGDYKIPIPETMYLSNDQSFGIKYNFMQKDPSKYARIQVKFDYGDYSYPVSYFNNGRRLPLMEEVEVSVEIFQGMKEMGFEVMTISGPDYININGEIVMKVGFDRKDPFPTHVDIYSFYLPSKCTTITTSYRISDAKEWKSVIEASIRMMKRDK